ncbi:hypothetical protein [Marilutibacter chinensis]|uniref:Uncharacterized protein n=1 Tax=Marilutibacter chinensis TaxID=2912247 RepID=A0ABS9HXR8_9GAMM|nr:hypothetical protein [Lysobacter chinensis]MCF7222932.1 hypothetical protein [Lysobacter chinensis]
MSAVAPVFDQVIRLLAMLPGVEVSSRHPVGDRVRLEIVCTDIRSTVEIRRLCMAANVAMAPVVLDPSCAGDMQHSCFSLSADTTAMETISHGNLQLLGIHLVWHLHRRDVLPADAANLLLRGWSAAPVGP